jgi:hypothetical protein
MDVIRAGRPVRLTDPINLEQFAARILASFPENTVLSPVTGFTSSSPALIMPRPPLLLSVSTFLQPAAPRLCAGVADVGAVCT